jgi:UDP-GlcNAc:undecaprenyl-phosphate GlcNAc-1-phosphate transferase
MENGSPEGAMRSYLILFTMALFLALGLTPAVRRWAMAWGAVDWPDGRRRIHQRPMPRLGGLAIYLAFVVTLLCVPLLGTLVSQGFRRNWMQVVSLIAPATLVFLLGVYDDFRGANAAIKFSVQLVAVAILYLCGFQINSVSLPFGGSWEIPVMLSFPLTALWVIGITNAFNLIDGMDGLATGASVFALLSLFVCSLSQGHPEISLMSIVLVGAAMGFLRYNFNPATIFLGDSGSLFLGFMAAALSLASAQKGATIIAVAIPLVSFGLPIVEVCVSVARRFISGDALFQSDRRHIHHMLLKRGLNQRQAAILLYGVCALFSLFGLMLLNRQRNTMALTFFVLGVGIVLGVQHLHYAEFDALKQKIKQGVTQRRRTLAAEAHVRRSAVDLELAQSAEELLAALSEWRRSNDFDCVRLEVGEPESYPIGREDWSDASPGNGCAPPAAWQWSCAREGLLLADVIASNRFWSLRVPLSAEGGSALGVITFYRDLARGAPATDLTQVCGLMWQELSAALERLRRKDLIVSETIPSRSPRPERLWVTSRF